MLVNTQNVLRKTHEETIAEEKNVPLASRSYPTPCVDMMIC
jgi:hypothetical protein